MLTLDGGYMRGSSQLSLFLSMLEIFHNKKLILNLILKEPLSLTFQIKSDFISLALPGQVTIPEPFTEIRGT